MTRFWVVLGVFLTITFSASAQDEAWPESVAPAYAAYETAMAERDFAAAYEAAETAWRAGQEARIEPARRGRLAENYALLALAFRQYDTAFEAWHEAAEMSDRVHAPAPERARRWYGAALAAFAGNNPVEAQQSAQSASEIEEGANPPLESRLSGDIHYLLAMTSSELGQMRAVGEHARLALAGFAASGRAYDQRYASAYYLSGFDHFLFGDKVESAIAFHFAQHIFGTLDGPDNETATLRSRMWIRMAQGDLSARELEQVSDRIAASALPEAATYQSTVRTDLPELEAEPINRVPLRYPGAAQRQGIEGVVLLQYVVNEEGRVEDVQIIASMPGGVFDAVCIQEVEGWVYEPLLVDGVPIRRMGETDFIFAFRGG